jgi:hypothetical protein
LSLLVLTPEECLLKIFSLFNLSLSPTIKKLSNSSEPNFIQSPLSLGFIFIHGIFLIDLNFEIIFNF